MAWGREYGGWGSYVSAAEKRERGRREVARLNKAGRVTAPVVLEGRKIAHTFWGQAWCENLESYVDYANRLPRGRTYVRNGSVLDLQVEAGKVTALVSGSELYEIAVTIRPLERSAWTAIARECSGKIDSVIELLAGRLSRGVMEVVSKKGSGLFPSPKEITLSCSCPDYAGLCKHVAAALYGVGARLDEKPELLFTLRKVDATDLVEGVDAGAALGKKATQERVLSGRDLSSVFGIELAGEEDVAAPKTRKPSPKKAATTTKKKTAPRAATRPTGGRVASDQSFVDYVCDQVRGVGRLAHKKMFGEYAIYVDDKLVALVADNQLFVKPTPAGRALLGTPVEAPPYPGAKPCFLIDELDRSELLTALFRATADGLPEPKPKRPKATKKKATKKKATKKKATKKRA